MRKVISFLAILIFVDFWQAGFAEGGHGQCRPYFRLAKNPVNADRVNGIKHRPGRSDSPQPRDEEPWLIADVLSAYKVPQNLSGDGVIGILELGGGWVQSDLDLFCSLNNLPPIQVTNISVDGTQNSPSNPPNVNSDDVEVTLDIQIAAATHYYATGKMPTINVFFAQNTFASFAAVINAAVAANCDVLSISWGESEDQWQLDDPAAALAQLEATAKSATAGGLVILAASGDDSSSDGDPGTNVDVPASCPHVVGCGGTTKTASIEIAWGDGVSTDSGTGGGYSVIFPVQSFQWRPRGSGRMVPDVAANADPNTGYMIVYGGSELQIGGTSCVSPLYAGLFSASGKKLGFISPRLWSHEYALKDITQGSNGAYSASRGPDPCTGLGVPNDGGVTGLFSGVGQTFTVNVKDRVAGNYQATLDFNDPDAGDFTVTGPSSTGSGTYRQVPPSAVFSTIIATSTSSATIFPGRYTAIIIDWKASGIPYLFSQTPTEIFGFGYGMNSSNTFEVYSFSGQE